MLGVRQVPARWGDTPPDASAAGADTPRLPVLLGRTPPGRTSRRHSPRRRARDSHGRRGRTSSNFTWLVVSLTPESLHRASGLMYCASNISITPVGGIYVYPATEGQGWVGRGGLAANAGGATACTQQGASPIALSACTAWFTAPTTAGSVPAANAMPWSYCKGEGTGRRFRACPECCANSAGGRQTAAAQPGAAAQGRRSAASCGWGPLACRLGHRPHAVQVGTPPAISNCRPPGRNRCPQA